MKWLKVKWHSEEYEAVLKKIVAQKAEIEELNARMDGLSSKFNSLRGRIYRNGHKEEEEETDTNKYNQFLPF